MKKHLLILATFFITSIANAQPFGEALWYDGINDCAEAESVSTEISAFSQ